MNRHGDKQASELHAHAVCKPGAVCDPASDPDLVEAPEADVPARSALAFGETEGVLYSLVRLVGQRDRHTAGHCERLASSGVVNVKAEDDSYEIFVDGAFVGNTPAKVKLAEGSHVVEVKKTGFKDYRKNRPLLSH